MKTATLTQVVIFILVSVCEADIRICISKTVKLRIMFLFSAFQAV